MEAYRCWCCIIITVYTRCSFLATVVDDRMVKVLLDTSFIIAMANRPIKGMERLEVHLGRIEFLIPDVVVRELERMVESAGVKRAREARAALQLTNDARFRIIGISKVDGDECNGSTPVDDAIVEYAESVGCYYVATLDKEMIKRLKGRCAGIVTLQDDILTIV